MKQTPISWLLMTLSASTIHHVANPKSLYEPTTVAHSVNEFSASQGAHGWQYGHWNQSADDDGSYQQHTDFQLFSSYGDDRINGLSRHSEFVTGPLWYLDDGRYYTSVWASGGHAHAELELGTYAKANHWVIRRWTSDVSGDVEISGVYGKVMPWGELWGGQAIYQVMVDDTIHFKRSSDTGEQDYAFSVAIKPGSIVDFMIGPGPAIGVVSFTGAVTLKPRP